MITLQHARKLRQLIVKASESLTDTEALEGIELFDEWNGNGHEYKKNDRVRYNGLLYKYIANDPTISQPSWTPAASPSLWVRVDDPSQEWPEWRQPTGSTDAYALGDKVSHNDKHWISDYDNNTWEPGVFGWSEAE